jgi:hypothetical protein
MVRGVGAARRDRGREVEVVVDGVVIGFSNTRSVKMRLNLPAAASMANPPTISARDGKCCSIGPSAEVDAAGANENDEFDRCGRFLPSGVDTD